MTTQPSDWAVAPCPFCGGQPKTGETNTGVPGMEDCGYAFVECCVVHVHSEESQEDAIAIWNTRAPVARELDASGTTNSAQISSSLVVGDTERLDWIERTFRGMSNGERYLPLVMGWGKGANGRTLREAIDKYMRKEAAMGGEGAGD